MLSVSPWLGVTTVVFGNYGFAIALRPFGMEFTFEKSNSLLERALVQAGCFTRRALSCHPG
jgi:hypothetical protein